MCQVDRRLVLRTFIQAIAAGVFEASISTGCSPAPSLDTANLQLYPLTQEKRIDYASHNNYGIQSLDGSPSGSKIAIGVGQVAFIYENSRDTLTQISEPSSFTPLLAWNSNGSWLAGGNKDFWLWDDANSQLSVMSRNSGSFRYYGQPYWSSADQYIGLSRITGPDARIIEIFEVSNQSLHEYSVPDVANPIMLAWGLNDQFICIGSSKASIIYIVDFESHRVIQELPQRSDILPIAVWNSTGELLATSSEETPVTVWDTSTWESLITIDDLDDVFAIKWHQAGDHLAVAGQSGVRIINVNTEVETLVQTEPSRDLDWNKDGSELITSASDTIRKWTISSLP